jgi:serine/threonine protein kinase
VSERESEIERICQATLDCPPETRAEELAKACSGDAAMRREVEALLAFEAAADGFMATPASWTAASRRPNEPDAGPPLTFALPSRLGPYEIESILGTGGMGEVYRARDTRLDRDVALKVLPPSLAADPERLARFQREARVLASMNHPNIAQLYGVEQQALVMELVDGETLKAPLPMPAALDCAGQIAAALEAAHEKGIVHRDLKPANVMTTPQGVVKVLDFGLAMTEDSLRINIESGRATDPSGYLPPSSGATRVGMIMGTAAYMSPEQASGKPADKRADIWSFGVVLWELLTGRSLFEAGTLTKTLSNVSNAPIDFRQLPRDTHPAIRDLLARCLDRDAKTRLRDIGEARIQIQRCLATPTAATPPFSKERMARAATWVGTCAAVVFAILLAIERWTAQRPETLEPVRFVIPAPQQTTVTSGLALSPDGRQVAFTAKRADGRVRIWVHSFDLADAHSLPGTEDAFSPLFWSPDSRFVGFATGMTLKKVAVAGGPPFTLCDRCGPASIGSRVFRGGSWNSGGVIVYAISSNGLWRIPEAGGAPLRLSSIGDYGCPTFLPDGEHFLYTWFGRDPKPGIYVGAVRDLEQRPSRPLMEGAFVLSAYAPSRDASVGHLLALREGILTAQPFNTRTLALSGEPALLAESVPAVSPPWAFSASATGALAFSTTALADSSRLQWFDRSGTQLAQLGPLSYDSNISISPDGRRIAFDRIESDRRTRRIWSADKARGVLTLLDPSTRAWSPVISSDGRVAFTSAPDIYLTKVSASAPPELLHRSPNLKHPNDWSPDGRFLIFDDHHPTRRHDLLVLRIGDHEPIPLVATEADEGPAAFSPDGKWIAYSSDETGRSEIIVRDFVPDRVPAVGSFRITVSTNGGDKPRWRRDGRELYYIAPDGRLMAVPVRTAPTFDPGVPVALFETHVPKGSFFPYDVAQDGRFLVDTLDDPSFGPSARMTVVLNWATRLTKH